MVYCSRMFRDPIGDCPPCRCEFVDKQDDGLHCGKTGKRLLQDRGGGHFMPNKDCPLESGVYNGN